MPPDQPNPTRLTQPDPTDPTDKVDNKVNNKVNNKEDNKVDKDNLRPLDPLTL